MDSIGAGPTARARLVLELGLDDDGRPVGRVEPGTGSPVEFTGWLALMAELTRLAAPGPGRPAPASTQGGSRDATTAPS